MPSFFSGQLFCRLCVGVPGSSYGQSIIIPCIVSDTQLALEGIPQAGELNAEGAVRRLEDFDFAFNTSIKKSKIFELSTSRFISQHRDLLIVGPPGTGESHIAQAIGHAAIRSGLHVYYRSIFDVVRDVLNDEAMEGYEKTLQRYLKPDLLIIDDMGMKQLPKRSGEYFFEIVMRRYELRSTLMTSNRPLEDWNKLIGDVPSATAILDRFLTPFRIWFKTVPLETQNDSMNFQPTNS